MVALDTTVCQASEGIPSSDRHSVSDTIAHFRSMQADIHQLNRSDNPEQLFVSDLTHLLMRRVSGPCSSNPLPVNR